jgi:hypothetical protein
MDNVAQVQSAFFGHEHMDALLRVVGEDHLAWVLNQINNFLDELVVQNLCPYITELSHGLPKQLKAPKFIYGTKGCIGFFDAKLKDIKGYEQLSAGVLQTFREVGNMLTFANMIDGALVRNLAAT